MRILGQVFSCVFPSWLCNFTFFDLRFGFSTSKSSPGRISEVIWLELRGKTKDEQKSKMLTILSFLFFGLWTPESSNFDLKFGFLVNNCIFCQLDMSRIPKFGPQMVYFQFPKLKSKNDISRRPLYFQPNDLRNCPRGGFRRAESESEVKNLQILRLETKNQKTKI